MGSALLDGARRLTLGVTLATLGCAPPPKLPVLAQVEDQESNEALRRAAAIAPQSYAHAQQLRARAEEAQEAGDPESAKVLADQALAAQEQTLVQARLVRAKQRQEQLSAEEQELEAQLAKMAGLQQALAAEAKALELRVLVVRDAEPLEAPEAASPGREAARRKAARQLLEEGQLLCVAARMVKEGSDLASAAMQELKAVESELDKGVTPVPVDGAYKVRGDCLHALTVARRTNDGASAHTLDGNALLDELSATLPDNPPHRDDRGVVVPVTGPLVQGGVLTPASSATFETLARIAKERTTPVLIVVHAPPQQRDELLAALQASPLGRLPGVELFAAAAVQHPAVTALKHPPKKTWVEVVFVQR